MIPASDGKAAAPRFKGPRTHRHRARSRAQSSARGTRGVRGSDPRVGHRQQLAPQLLRRSVRGPALLTSIRAATSSKTKNLIRESVYVTCNALLHCRLVPRTRPGGADRIRQWDPLQRRNRVQCLLHPHSRWPFRRLHAVVGHGVEKTGGSREEGRPHPELSRHGRRTAQRDRSGHSF